MSAQLELITPDHFTKYQKLLEVISNKQTGFGWKPTKTRDRLVIFTERIETLRFLQQNLKKELKLKDAQVEILYGTLSDLEQQRIVEAFGQEDSPVRVLICSDVASEGINLHWLSHRMIHFDIPWSLMVFQQRNGRIDRYGQEHSPQIVYLTTESQNATIRGDNRILEVLIEKDEQAMKNIGDPSAFMGVYDTREEERLTAAAIEQGVTAEAFDKRYQPKKKTDRESGAFDPFAEDWFAPASSELLDDPATQCTELLTLFGSDYGYMKSAIIRIREKEEHDRITQIDTDDSKQRLEFTAPESLKFRFDKLSREIWPKDGHFILSAEKTDVAEAIKESRRSEESWPKVHYLWEQHPVCHWINDKVAGSIKRQQAPVMVLEEGLTKGEVIYLVSALIPNRKGHPVIHQWLGVTFIEEQFHAVDSLESILKKTRLGQQPVPNREERVDFEALQKHLPEVVTQVEVWMKQQRLAYQQAVRPKLKQQIERLSKQKNRHMRQLEMKLEKSQQAEVFIKARREKEARDINKRFEEYLQWIKDTLRVEDQPYIKIVVALIHTPDPLRPV